MKATKVTCDCPNGQVVSDDKCQERAVDGEFCETCNEEESLEKVGDKCERKK